MNDNTHEDRDHSRVLELLNLALGRLENALAALNCQSSPEAATVLAAKVTLIAVRNFWRGDGDTHVADVALTLRSLANELMPINHHEVRGAYQDLREAEGIVEQNTYQDVPISR